MKLPCSQASLAAELPSDNQPTKHPFLPKETGVVTNTYKTRYNFESSRFDNTVVYIAKSFSCCGATFFIQSKLQQVCRSDFVPTATAQLTGCVPVA